MCAAEMPMSVSLVIPLADRIRLIYISDLMTTQRRCGYAGSDGANVRVMDSVLIDIFHAAF